MAGIFKKAMGLFVEFEGDKATHGLSKTDSRTNVERQSTKPPDAVPSHRTMARPVLNQETFEKFEQHFEKLFDQANLPGPDYYEFWKMSETLEAHIKDEGARIAATYASLAIQGLTKAKLIETAEKYKTLVEQDQDNFEKAAREKGEHAISQQQQQVKQLEERIAQHSETIRKLTQEITESQAAMKVLQGTIGEEQQKLEANKQGYALACEAMLRKINDDITKIQTNL
jgi:chromosome segregation ATPase